MSNQTALAIIAGNTGTTEQEVTEVIRGMIVSAKKQTRKSRATKRTFCIFSPSFAVRKSASSYGATSSASLRARSKSAQEARKVNSRP